MASGRFTDKSIASPKFKSPEPEEYNQQRKVHSISTKMFDYSMRERDDIESDDMDILRDSETDFEVANKSKQELTNYINQMTQQLMSGVKPPRPIPVDQRTTLKPMDVNHNMIRSPSVKDSFHAFQNTNEYSFQSQNSRNHSQRRSKSKITRVVSRKKFKEDQVDENIDPNSAFSPANYQNRQISPAMYSGQTTRVKMVEVEGRKIEFGTKYEENKTVSSNNPTPVKSEDLQVIDVSDTDGQYQQFPSNEHLITQLEEIEQKRFGDRQIADVSSCDKQQETSGIYHNTTESSKRSQGAFATIQAYDQRKAQALKELDDIIASSEDEITGVNNYHCRH